MASIAALLLVALNIHNGMPTVGAHTKTRAQTATPLAASKQERQPEIRKCGHRMPGQRLSMAKVFRRIYQHDNALLFAFLQNYQDVTKK